MRRALIAALLVAYAILTLFPFDWDLPGTVPNGAVRAPDGSVAFPSPGIAWTESGPSWAPAAIRTNRLAIELEVRPNGAEQHGPARIFTVSADPWNSNMTIGQDGEDLIVRLRTAWTDRSGDPPARVRGVFASQDWVAIEVRVSPGVLEVRVDSALRARTTIPDAPLEAWEARYRLAFGNEFTFDRPWLGRVRRAAVRSAGGTTDYLATDSPLVLPTQLWAFHRSPQVVPFRTLDLDDAALNVLFFVPLGVALSLGALHGDPRARLRALLLAFAFSLSLEILQLLVPSRQPSINDVIMNTLGAALGAALVRRWRR